MPARTSSNPSEPSSDIPGFSYWTIQPNRWTFQSPKVRAWVEHHLQGRVLNACCGITHLEYSDELVRNDLQRRITHNGTVYETDADTHVDVHTLTSEYPAESFDTIVYDPPFSTNQSQTAYNLQTGIDPTTVAAELHALLKPGGRLIACGFNTRPLADEYRYDIERVALWNLLGRQHDWLGTVLQKPTTPTGTSSEVTMQVDATPNPVDALPALDDTDVVAGGNDGQPVALTYQRLPGDTPTRTAVADTVLEGFQGHVLVVGTDVHAYREVYDGPITLNSPDTSWGLDTRFVIQDLADEYTPASFDHVVLDLPSEATQKTIEYEGETTGYDTVAKQQVHELLEPGGTVSMVGHTATVMSATTYDAYHRQAVTILAHPNADADTIVATDLRTTGGRPYPQPVTDTELDASAPPADLQVAPDVWSGEANYACSRCATSWYWHPAFHTDCPRCGARPGNYCVDDTDTPISVIHSHRLAAWQQGHIGHHDTRELATTSLDAAAGFGGAPDDSQQLLSGYME